jgi:hypothetical protein
LNRWFQQANYLIQRLGHGKAGHLALPDFFMAVGSTLLARGASLGERIVDGQAQERREYLEAHPAAKELEGFMLAQLLAPKQGGARP